MAWSGSCRRRVPIHRWKSRTITSARNICRVAVSFGRVGYRRHTVPSLPGVSVCPAGKSSRARRALAYPAPAAVQSRDPVALVGEHMGVVEPDLGPRFLPLRPYQAHSFGSLLHLQGCLKQGVDHRVRLNRPAAQGLRGEAGFAPDEQRPDRFVQGLGQVLQGRDFFRGFHPEGYPHPHIGEVIAPSQVRREVGIGASGPLVGRSPRGPTLVVGP